MLGIVDDTILSNGPTINTGHNLQLAPLPSQKHVFFGQYRSQRDSRIEFRNRTWIFDALNEVLAKILENYYHSHENERIKMLNLLQTEF